MTHCFVIPSYQHSHTLEGTLNELSKFSYACVVVNDGSDHEHTNKLREVCAKFSWVHLIEHEFNEGKGGAVITGLKKAEALECSHAIQVDSDGQHELDQVEALVKASTDNPSAVISGLPVYDSTVPLGRKMGRYITHFWVWIETLSFQLKDSMCGFRVYPLAPTLQMLQNSGVGRRMDFDIEVLVRLFWSGVAIEYVPVKVIYPEDGSSNFNVIKDNVLISKMHTKLFFGMLIRFPKLIINKFKKNSKKEHWAELDEKGLIVGIRFLFLVYRVFGRKVLSLFLKVVCFYYQLFALQARRASADYRLTYNNYCEANALQSMNTSFYAHVYSFADTILDKLVVWQGLYRKSVINKDDYERFCKLKKQKSGGVFIGAHFGNIDVARALGRDNPDKKFVALVYADNAVKFNSCLEAVNGEATLNMISVKNFSPDIAIMLKDRVERGEWVFIMGDRDSVAKVEASVSVEVLGRKTTLPYGPFLLGYLLDVPVYSFFCYKEGAKSFRIKFNEITPALERTRKNRNKFINELAHKYASDLTGKIVAAPLQWFNFYKFWK